MKFLASLIRSISIGILFALQAGAAQLGDWLLQQAVTGHLKVHWDNQDDTRFDGVLAIDARTGRVAVLMSNDFG